MKSKKSVIPQVSPPIADCRLPFAEGANAMPGGRSPISAWLFDLYAQDRRMVLWFLLPDGTIRRAVREFSMEVLLEGPGDVLDACLAAVEAAGDGRRRGWTQWHDFWTGKARSVFALHIFDLEGWKKKLEDYAFRFPALSWYNADLLPEQVFCYQHGIFPLAECTAEIGEDGRLIAVASKDDPWRTDYEEPPLRVARLSGDGTLVSGWPRLRSLSLEIEGKCYTWDEPAYLLEGFQRALDDVDPDVLLTDGGDGFLFPLILSAARRQGITLTLDREPHPPIREIRTEGHSFMSYGRVLFKQPDYPLYGRWHLDKSNSFMTSKTGLDGVFEVTRVSRVPIQRIGRRSIGTGLTAVQIAMAFEKRILIPWKKTYPEAWKTAEQLLKTDRGGLVYAPETGFHERVVELDFASMYPSIMSNFNVSPETVNCPCCSNQFVPEINYSICEKRRGLVSASLDPIIAKRSQYKKERAAARAAGDEAAYRRANARQESLKWMLVCSFGYLGYRNARFGRIEAHEAVSSYSRELLTRTREECERAGWEMLHANVDAVWVVKPRFDAGEVPLLIEEINQATNLSIALEGIYKWIAYLPSRQVDGRPVPTRYFGVFEDGSLKFRGIECRRNDLPRFVRRVQLEQLEWLAANVANGAEYRAAVPELRARIAELEGMLWRYEVPLDDLLLTTLLSREPAEYKGNGPSALAARQAIKAKLDYHAGQAIEYLLTDAGNPDKDRRVRLAELIDFRTSYDPAAYVRLLRRAMNTLLWPAGVQLEEQKIQPPWETNHRPAVVRPENEQLDLLGS